MAKSNSSLEGDPSASVIFETIKAGFKERERSQHRLRRDASKRAWLRLITVQATPTSVEYDKGDRQSLAGYQKELCDAHSRGGLQWCQAEAEDRRATVAQLQKLVSGAKAEIDRTDKELVRARQAHGQAVDFLNAIASEITRQETEAARLERLAPLYAQACDELALRGVPLVWKPPVSEPLLPERPRRLILEDLTAWSGPIEQTYRGDVWKREISREEGEARVVELNKLEAEYIEKDKRDRVEANRLGVSLADLALLRRGDA